MATVALLGSRPLGRRCLESLHEYDDVTVDAVVTYPPDHDGWWEGSLHERATELGYTVYDHEDGLFDHDLDYLISTLYFNILDGDVLEIPEHCGINLHQAELPRYRGSNSFSHAIMNARNDDYWQYGTTLHVMTEELDAGDIIERRFVDITETDTARSLYEKTEDASHELFESVLPEIAAGTVEEGATPQSEFDDPSYYYGSDSLDGEKEIPLSNLTADDHAVYDKVRAVDFPPFEPAYTEIGGEKVYLTRSGYGDPEQFN